MKTVIFKFVIFLYFVKLSMGKVMDIKDEDLDSYLVKDSQVFLFMYHP